MSARRFSLRRELTFGLLVYALYLLVRKLVLDRDGRARALRNAERVVAAERRLALNVEPRVQRALLRFPRVVYGLNLGYAVFNVGLTLGWLVLLYRRRDPGYHRLRRACVLAHVGAQPIFLLFPTAPPRALDGFVDTLSEVSGFDLEHPRLVRLYNPVAAMPSLHIAFAVVTGAAIAERSESHVAKSAAYTYPALVSLVVAGTGNHYVLDAVAGAALGAVARRAAEVAR
jgi:PAP2 superfamily